MPPAAMRGPFRRRRGAGRRSAAPESAWRGAPSRGHAFPELLDAVEPRRRTRRMRRAVGFAERAFEFLEQLALATRQADRRFDDDAAMQVADAARAHVA